MPESGSSEKTEITLGLLNAVQDNESVTQRSVASELGIALGLANSYLKRCIKKGLIKVKQVPPNRYAYYLTPKGFAEKSRLTAEYLSSSFTFFRRARQQCEAALADARRRGWRRVALWGASDLAEIAALCNHEVGLDLVVVAEGAGDVSRFAGLPAVDSLESAGMIDGVVITDLDAAQSVYDQLIQVMPDERIMAPQMLHISRSET